MQNAPAATSGVAIVSGDATAATIFDQGASSHVVQVNVQNSQGQGPGDTIFIRVLGTSEAPTGYQAQLWFCDSGTVNGYETFAVNSSTGAFTSTTVETSNSNTFVGIINASLTSSGGEFVFDPAQTRSAEVYFSGGSINFKGLVNIPSGGSLTAQASESEAGMSSVNNKHSIFANYSGNTMGTLRFSESGFAFEQNFTGGSQNVVGACEYQTTKYSPVSSGSLFTSASGEDFSNSIFTTDISTYTALVSAKSSFSCSQTPDVVVSMDMSSTGMQAVQSQCDNPFQEMNFCDGSAVSSVREKVILAQLGFGSCSTTYCIVGNDFSCQQWADNNLGNPEGLSTANAHCSSSGCCEAQ